MLALVRFFCWYASLLDKSMSTTKYSLLNLFLIFLISAVFPTPLIPVRSIVGEELNSVLINKFYNMLISSVLLKNCVSVKFASVMLAISSICFPHIMYFSLYNVIYCILNYIINFSLCVVI